MKSRDESRLSRLTACATSASRLRQSRAVPQVAGKLLITIFVSLGGAMIIAKRNRQDRGPFTPADEKPRRISAQQANSLRHVGIPFAAKPRCITKSLFLWAEQRLLRNETVRTGVRSPPPMKSRDESRLSRLTACATSASRLRQSRAVLLNLCFFGRSNDYCETKPSGPGSVHPRR